MQTSLARRQRQRRKGYRNRPKGNAAVAAGAIALPLFLFSTFLIVGFIGFAGAVSAYSYFSQGLDEPKSVLENLTFDQQSKIYDRSGDIELAKLGDDRREVITFQDIPPELIDANPMGSKPEFSQNVLSSIAVVASMSAGGMSWKVMTSRRSSPSFASSMSPDRS